MHSISVPRMHDTPADPFLDPPSSPTSFPTHQKSVTLYPLVFMKCVMFFLNKKKAGCRQ